MKILLSVFFLSTLITAQNLDTTVISINNIRLPMVNDGDIGNDDGLVSYGGYYNNIMYSPGFFLSGKFEDSIWTNGVFESERVLDYNPGRYGDDINSSKNKFYIIKAADEPFGESWIEWKDAVELGAYFYDGDSDGIYNPVDKNENGNWDADEDRPDLIGDYTNWTVYNDNVPNEERRYNGAGQPQGIEVRQTTFAYSFPGNEILNNAIFFRYIIENKGNVPLFDSVYWGFVADPDIGNYGTDITGCDTILNSTFGYKRIPDYPGTFGDTPPTVLFSLLQGPKILGSSSDTSFIRRGEYLDEEIIIGKKNLEMTSSYSFRRYGIQSYEKQKVHRNIMIGGIYYNGDSAIVVRTYPFGNGDSLGSAADTINPKYMFSGNPVTGEGWLNIFETDWRIIGSTGPFKLEKNKPQEIIIALIVGRGDSPLNSVTVAKEYARGVRRFYESNFTDLPVSIKELNNNIPRNFELYQNYPNPFNPSTTIKYSIPMLETLHTMSQEWVQLEVYDILGREVATLINKQQKPGSYEVRFDASSVNQRISSGVYFYQLKIGGLIKTKKMILLQ